ncbi:thioredoxin family protein [Mesorhizobium sp. B2-3-5]|uniref:thioredoxin family protein n=1 Tax=Mesorhizobium sp. B2-3-5 TaxID=2589958 RepID=UPI001128F3C2|nr:thioredoxin family protein [Mesorhizobium sp. B2-3-5]TPM26926.1 hypothetical protein FJ958_18950 [Mesorhizobium sp. B2-3-5]
MSKELREPIEGSSVRMPARPVDGLHNRHDRIEGVASTECRRRAFILGGIAAAAIGLATGYHGQALAISTQIGPIRTVPDFEQALALSRMRNAAAVVDVAAKWCAFCRVLDERILVDPRVAALLRNLALIRIDVTAMDESNVNLLAHLGVFGPPTIMVVDTASGAEFPNTRSVGAFDAADLVARLRPFAR